MIGDDFLNFKNICDCHNHSNHSYDAVSSIFDMFEKGKELGFLYHAITDHCECEDYFHEVQPYKSVVENSYADMLKIKEFNPNFLIGIELGQIISSPQNAKLALTGRNYDVVIGSVHKVKGYDDFYYWSRKKLDPFFLIDRYFEEIMAMIEVGGFDTLAHLTYPLRYMFHENGERVNFDNYHEQIEAVFKLLIEKGIALEVNSSGLRQDIGEVLPNENFIKMYKSIGGELITVGSDAHCTVDLGSGLQETYQLLSDIGYKQIAVFKERKPVMIDLK